MVTDTFSQGEPRVLGLAMIPGHHVISIEVEADSLEDAQGFGAKHWQKGHLSHSMSCWAWTSHRILTLTSTDAVSGLNNEEMAFWSDSHSAHCIFKMVLAKIGHLKMFVTMFLFTLRSSGDLMFQSLKHKVDKIIFSFLFNDMQFVLMFIHLLLEIFQ